MRDEDHEQDGESGEDMSDSKIFRKLIFVIDQVEMYKNQHDIESNTYTGHVDRIEISKTQ